MPAVKSARRSGAKRAAKTTPTAAAAEKLNGIGAAAVLRATGKTWAQWLTLLDKAGADRLSHAQIARLLHEELGVPPWWSQMVTVGYEQARGRRVRHQTATGFSVSASKTIAATVSELFKAWNDARVRAKWLPGVELTIRKATAPKSLRMTWGSGAAATNVDVNLTAKGGDKAHVAVEHSKHKSETAAKRAKKYWAERLDTLKTLLEG